MRKSKYLLFTLVILSAILLGACNLPANLSTEDGNATIIASTANVVFTRAAETAGSISAQSTATTETLVATALPSDTPVPTLPPAAATNTPIPCNWASFVKDVTYPDDTAVPAGTVFTKTWRIKNNGSCNWTSGYVLLFDSGDQMNAPATGTVTSGTVTPGATVDISVNLTAPASPGTYRGRFKLRSPDNIVFGINADAQGPFWVQIVVPNPTPTATTVPVAKADLYISNIEYVPPSFKKGDSITVKVSVYNGGNAPAGPFTFAWWPAVGYGTPPPQCTWNKASLVAIGGYVEDCSFVYLGCSTYTTYAIADTTNAVTESDETNNQLDKVQVVPCS